MAKSFSLDGLVNPEAKTETQTKTEGQAVTPKATKPRAPTKPDPEPAAPAGPSKRLSLSLDAETYRELRFHAAESGRTHQDILADATRAYLRKHART